MVLRVSSIRPFSSDIFVRQTDPGMILSDGDTIRFVNQAGLRMLGAHSLSDVVGRSLAGFFPSGAPQGWTEDGGSHRHKWYGVDGRTLDVAVAVTRLTDRENGLVIEVHDAASSHHVESAVALARSQLNRRAAERSEPVKDGLQHHEGLVGVDPIGHITFSCGATERLTGWTEEELLGADIETALMKNPDSPAGDHQRLFDSLRETGGWQRGGAIELTLWRRDGTNFPVELAIVPVETGEAGNGAIFLFRDLSAEKHTEDRLRLASAVFDNAAEGIAVLDANFRVTTINPAFSAVTGFDAVDVQGRRPFFLTTTAADGELVDEIWTAIRQNGRWESEHWSARKDGQEYAVWLSISATTDEVGNISQYVVVFSDITQRKRDEERIRYQATYDALTGLPNRSLFMDRLSVALHQAQRHGHRVGLMFIDLDGFKLINDTLGHDVGDELLKEVAQRLLVCVRQGDTVTRFGGDEFTIIMPDLGEMRNVLAIAHRIVDTLKLPFQLKGAEAYISASIGITSFPDDAQTVQALLKNADAAMYRAKETGKANFQFYTHGLDAESTARLAIKNGLSKALERQEFELLYQPKCDVATGRLTGAEALLRWRSHEMGMMLPATFIPVLEETGLIDRVGDWVLETACHQHRVWRDAGHGHMRVAVNLSVRQLRQGTLVKTVENLLGRYSIDPSGLELEITESMIMKDTENAVAVLKDLFAMGVHLTMDDFGTGYSSLSYLKRFPQNTIKIDRSFVNDIAVDPDDLEIIRTIINMGHSLRRNVVAEGVETEAQRQLLHHLRCDEMQGFLLSPPVPPTDIDVMLATTRHGNPI
jgi:diguanylate cyclase (GGDEF)-like protein/PAS domain S-box-containing protein